MSKTLQICILFKSLLILISSCNVFKTDGKENNSEPIYHNEFNNNFHIQKKESYLISFYNVENLFDTINQLDVEDEEFTPEGFKKWTSSRYIRKLKNISAVLSQIDSVQLPSIIGLCEVENKKVCEELISQNLLLPGKYKIIHKESPDSRGIDVALLYKPDEFTYYFHKTIDVNVSSSPHSKLRDILYVKGAFYNSDTIHVFVNHWKSRYPSLKETEAIRNESAEILRKEIINIYNIDNDAQIVIMGDFNDEPNNTSLQKILMSYDKGNYIKLYNLMVDADNKAFGTISRNYQWFMFDNMIVSNSLLDGKTFYVKAKKGYIYNDKSILYYNSKADMYIPNKTYGGKNYYGGFSDHLPIYFYLTRK